MTKITYDQLIRAAAMAALIDEEPDEFIAEALRLGGTREQVISDITERTRTLLALLKNVPE